MAAQVQITSIAKFMGQLRVIFNVVLTGSYPAGGDPTDFTNFVKASTFIGEVESIPTSLPPVALDFWSQDGNLDFQYTAVLGATIANSKLKISAADTFGTEFTAGAYSAPLKAAKITGEAIFNTPLL